MSSLMRRGQQTVVRSSNVELARRGLGGLAAGLGIGAILVPFIASFIPLVGTGLLAIVMMIVGLVLLLK